MLLFAVLLQTAAVAPPAAVLPWKWSWDKISTFSYGTNTSCCGAGGNTSCCSGIDSPEEIRWKLQYDVLLVDNDLSAPGCQNGAGKINWTKCNDFRAARAGEVKAVDPKKPVFVYRGGPFGCDMSTANGGEQSDPATKWHDWLATPPVWRTVGDTWLVDRFNVTNPGTCDFRKEAAQHYWLTQMVFGPDKRWLEDSRIDGIFCDSGLVMGWQGTHLNITVGDVREIFNGTIATMKRMAVELNARNKFLTFSLKDHFASANNGKTGGGTSGGQLCDPTLDPAKPIQGNACWVYGEEVLFEGMGDAVWIPFREYNIPSRDFGKANATAQPDGCAAAIETHALESQRMPTMACNNDGSLNSTEFPSPFVSPGNPTGSLSWLEQHQISLAAHLMGMEEYSYFGSGMHWDDPGWHVWWPEYNEKLGAPLGKFARDGYRFTRHFEHLTVTADCETLRAEFNWH